jgi:hypothetical protein
MCVGPTRNQLREDHLCEEEKKSDFLVILQIVDPKHLVHDIMFIFLPRKEREKIGCSMHIYGRSENVIFLE